MTGWIGLLRQIIAILSFHRVLLNWVRIRHNQFFDSETHTTKFHNVTLSDLNLLWRVLLLVRSVLNVLHRGHLLSFLVLKTDDLPSLLKVAILFIKIAIGLVQRLGVVKPVGASLIYDWEEHLVRVRASKLRHDRLECILVANQYETPSRAHFVVLEALRFVIEQAVGVPIPEQSVDLQVMVDSFNLLGRLPGRHRCLANATSIDWAGLHGFLSRLVDWSHVLIVYHVRLPREVVLAVDSRVSVTQTAKLRIVQL